MGEYHRNLATNIPENTVAFVGPNSDPDDFDNVQSVKLPDSSLAKGYKYIREQMQEFDIIHTGPFYHHLFADLNLEATIIHTVHNAEIYNGLKSIRNYRRSGLLRRANEVVTPSQYIAEHSQASKYKEKMNIIPNGVGTDVFSPTLSASKKNRILYIAGDWPRKNAKFALKIARDNPSMEFRFRISNLNKNTESIANNIDNVTLLPRLSQQGLAKEYSAAEAVICPYEREGFGLVIIESLASGTPVVGLNSGNIPELINNEETGILHESLDVSEWSRTLKERNFESLEACARNFGLEYDWNIISDEYLKLYNNSLN